MLSPGLKGRTPNDAVTPEPDALRRARLPPEGRESLILLAGTLVYDKLAAADNYRLIRWFYEAVVT